MTPVWFLAVLTTVTGISGETQPESQKSDPLTEDDGLRSELEKLGLLTGLHYTEDVANASIIEGFSLYIAEYERSYFLKTVEDNVNKIKTTIQANTVSEQPRPWGPLHVIYKLSVSLCSIPVGTV